MNLDDAIELARAVGNRGTLGAERLCRQSQAQQWVSAMIAAAGSTLGETRNHHGFAFPQRWCADEPAAGTAVGKAYRAVLAAP